VNLLSARVVLRPRPLADVLDLAVPFCLAARGPLLRLAAVLLLPLLSLCAGLRQAGWKPGAVWLAAVVSADLVEGAFTLAASELLFVEPDQLRVSAVLARFGRNLPRALLCLFLTRLSLVLGLALFPLVPVIAVRFIFAREAVLLEGAGPVAALTRSHRLVTGHVLTAVGLLGALLAIPAAGLIAAELLGDAVVAQVLQLGHPLGQLWRDGISMFALAGFFLSVPVLAAARFLAYIDLRTRKEGWDIQLRFAALSADEGPGGASGSQAA
jgi:hypothetical protein